MSKMIFGDKYKKGRKINHRNLVITAFIFLIAIVYIPVVFAASGDNISPNAFCEVDLFDLKKRGSCDSTKHTITNIDTYRIDTSHNFTNNDGQDVYVFYSNIDPGETKTLDLSSMDLLPDNFVGDVLVQGTGEIMGTKLPIPPSYISIDSSQLGSIIFPNTLYTVTVTVSPDDASLPITYTWHELGQPPIIQTGGISIDFEVSWSTSGERQISVSAENSAGSIFDEFGIAIQLFQGNFLPLTIR